MQNNVARMMVRNNRLGYRAASSSRASAPRRPVVLCARTASPCTTCRPVALAALAASPTHAVVRAVVAGSACMATAAALLLLTLARTREEAPSVHAIIGIKQLANLHMSNAAQNRQSVDKCVSRCTNKEKEKNVIHPSIIHTHARNKPCRRASRPRPGGWLAAGGT